MSFNIAVYHRSVPNAKNSEKVDVLKFFSEGATTAGDRVIDVTDKGFQQVDVAVIQGWSTIDVNTKDHLALRNRVIRTQLKHKRRSSASS